FLERRARENLNPTPARCARRPSPLRGEGLAPPHASPLGVAEWRKTRERGDRAMYKRILLPIDLADAEGSKPAIATALLMAGQSQGSIRYVNVLPLTPVMLAEYVPPDFEVQQRKAAEDALSIIVKETALPPERVSSAVRRGGIYQEILEEANGIGADLIVMSSHRPQRHAVRTYFLGSNT